MTDFEIALKAVQLYAEMHPRPPTSLRHRLPKCGIEY